MIAGGSWLVGGRNQPEAELVQDLKARPGQPYGSAGNEVFQGWLIVNGSLNISGNMTHIAALKKNGSTQA